MIFWTIYISLSFYALALGLLVAGPGNQSRRLARLAWTIAFGLFVAHMISAYHYQHHWSQADALRHAAKRTYDVVGLDWSGGVYVNYFFTLVWFADVVWWWVDASGHQTRPKWLWSAKPASWAAAAMPSPLRTSCLARSSRRHCR